jgi:hypothetical protein
MRLSISDEYLHLDTLLIQRLFVEISLRVRLRGEPINTSYTLAELSSPAPDQISRHGLPREGNWKGCTLA